MNLDAWIQSPYVGLIGTIVGIIGLVVALVALILYFKDRRTKEPSFAKKSINITRQMASRVPGLEIQFLDRPVQNFTITKIAFWNNGRATVEREDVVDPVRFRVRGAGTILQHEILYASGPSNNIVTSLGEERSEITLDFSYLDRHEGAVIKIAHTGRSGADIVVSGKMKGVKLIQRSITRWASGVAEGLWWILIAVMWASVVIVVFATAKAAFPWRVSLGCLLGLPVIHCLRLAYIHIFRMIPKTLKVFGQDF